MDKKILVPVGRDERGEEMIPYVEKVGQPGMKVLFLVRYLVDGIRWQKEKYGMSAALEAREMAHQYTWEANLVKARQKLAPACEALRAKGIEADVELYAGSVKKAIRSLTVGGDVQLILTCGGVWQRLVGFLSGNNSLSDLWRRPGPTPVLLIKPGMAT
jgi:hypothetical protein